MGGRGGFLCLSVLYCTWIQERHELDERKTMYSLCGFINLAVNRGKMSNKFQLKSNIYQPVLAFIITHP